MATLLRLGLVLWLSTSLVFAKGGQLYRGGTGFLFQDANDFTNPGQIALNKGFALQVDYTRLNASQSQELTPSVVHGNGSFGLGVFANRAGTNLGSATDSVDTIGGAIALGLAQERFTLGVGYERSISVGQTDDGVLGAALNYNGKGRVGFSLGAKFTTMVNAIIRRRTATAAAGYGISAHSALEAFYRFNDIESNTSDADWGASVTLGGPRYYFSAGYTQLKQLNVAEVSAWFGLNFDVLDIGIHAEKMLDAQYQYSYGGAIRLVF